MYLWGEGIIFKGSKWTPKKQLKCRFKEDEAMEYNYLGGRAVKEIWMPGSIQFSDEEVSSSGPQEKMTNL